MSTPFSGQSLSIESASLAQSVEFVVASRLQRGRSPDQIDSLFRKVDLLVDNKISEFQATRNSEDPPVCTSGCDSCCHRTVFATSIEAIHVAAFVEKTFPAVEKARIRGRLHQYVREVGPRMGRDLVKARSTCPFLDEGLCSVYEVRPLACRSHFSSNVASCWSARSDANVPFHLSTVNLN